MRKTSSENLETLQESKTFKIIYNFKSFQCSTPRKDFLNLTVDLVFEDNPDFYLQNLDQNLKFFTFLNNYNNTSNSSRMCTTTTAYKPSHEQDHKEV